MMEYICLHAYGEESVHKNVIFSLEFERNWEEVIKMDSTKPPQQNSELRSGSFQGSKEARTFQSEENTKMRCWENEIGKYNVISGDSKHTVGAL